LIKYCFPTPTSSEKTQLEIKTGNPLKISGKGGTSGRHSTKKAKNAEISRFSAF
jgi:hypothetical protein